MTNFPYCSFTFPWVFIIFPGFSFFGLVQFFTTTYLSLGCTFRSWWHFKAGWMIVLSLTSISFSHFPPHHQNFIFLKSRRFETFEIAKVRNLHEKLPKLMLFGSNRDMTRAFQIKSQSEATRKCHESFGRLQKHPKREVFVKKTISYRFVAPHITGFGESGGGGETAARLHFSPC